MSNVVLFFETMKVGCSWQREVITQLFVVWCWPESLFKPEDCPSFYFQIPAVHTTPLLTCSCFHLKRMEMFLIPYQVPSIAKNTFKPTCHAGQVSAGIYLSHNRHKGFDRDLCVLESKKEVEGKYKSASGIHGSRGSAGQDRLEQIPPKACYRLSCLHLLIFFSVGTPSFHSRNKLLVWRRHCLES